MSSPIANQLPSTSSLIRSVTTDAARSYQFYQVCRFLAVLLGGMILVKMGYSETEVSNFEWFLFSSHAMSFFWSLGLKNALLSYYPDMGTDDQRSLWKGLLVGFGIMAMAVSAVFIGLIGWDVVEPLWFGLYFVAVIPASLAEQYLILQKESLQLTKYAVWIHILYIAAILVGVYIGDLQSLVVALAVWAMVKLLYTLYLLRDALSIKFDFSVLRPFIVFAVPLVGYILLGSGMDVLDGYLVRYYLEPSDFAKFRYGAKELPITALMIGALATATIPQAVTHFDSTIADLRSRLSNMMNWMYPLSTILILFSPYLYSWYYSAEYVISAHIFNCFLLILISRIITPQVLLYALKENTVLLWTSLAELIINLVLSLYLMQVFGLLGIAYATVIAYTFEKIVLVAVLYFRRGINPSQYIDVPKYLGWSFVLGSVYIVSTILHG